MAEGILAKRGKWRGENDEGKMARGNWQRARGDVFQNPELFGTQVSLSPEQSTLGQVHFYSKEQISSK
jgi:hypothetical protein